MGSKVSLSTSRTSMGSTSVKPLRLDALVYQPRSVISANVRLALL